MPGELNREQVRSGGVSPPERRSTRITAVVTVLLAVFLSGSAPQAASTGPAETRIVPPIFRMMYQSGDQDRRITAARDALVTSCMAAHGHSYVIEAATATDTLVTLRPFGPESLESDPDEPLPAEPVHDEGYVRALFGDPGQRVLAQGQRLAISFPANGCEADAEHHLLGDQRVRAVELRLRIHDGESEAREQLDRDPAFIAVTERWRRCVHRLGVDAVDPGDLLRKLPSGIVDLATEPAVRADVRCKRATGYLDTAYARLAVLQQNWLDAHADLVAERLALRQRQHAAALQVLG
jgi:hypothetical protein